MDDLHHRFLGAVGFDHRMRREPVSGGLIAATPSPPRSVTMSVSPNLSLLPCLVPTHRDDPLDAQFRGGQPPAARPHSLRVQRATFDECRALRTDESAASDFVLGSM